MRRRRGERREERERRERGEKRDEREEEREEERDEEREEVVKEGRKQTLAPADECGALATSHNACLHVASLDRLEMCLSNTCFLRRLDETRRCSERQ